MASLQRRKVGVSECGKPHCQAKGPSDSKEPDSERDTGDWMAVDQSPSVKREGLDSELAEIDDTAVNPESTEEDQGQDITLHALPSLGGPDASPSLARPRQG